MMRHFYFSIMCLLLSFVSTAGCVRGLPSPETFIDHQAWTLPVEQVVRLSFAEQAGLLIPDNKGLPTEAKGHPLQSLDLSPIVPSPVAPVRCNLDTDGSNPAGFYLSDTWTPGEVVLTFDDGPHPSKTPQVLDLLKKHNMPATFFVVGHAIHGKTFFLLKRMVAEGHTIGAHSYNHDVGMSMRGHGPQRLDYIRGEHETTQILIHLALMADSEEDFNQMFIRVFEEKLASYLSSTAIRTNWRKYVERHEKLLEEQGFEGTHPYPVVFSRPPAGNPYTGASEPWQKALYRSALEPMGWLNVMWNGESGDTDLTRKGDFAFLTSNIKNYSSRGGILLVHDYIRTDALAIGLGEMAKNPRINVIPLEQAVLRKFGCSSLELAQQKRSAPAEMASR